MNAPAESGASLRKSDGPLLRSCEGLVIGLVAAAVVLGAMTAAYPVFRVGKEFDVPRIGMPPALFAANRREQDRVDRLNAMLFVAGLGGLMALGLAVREAALVRSSRGIFLAPWPGLLGGAVGGAAGCAVLAYVRENIGQAELTHSMLGQILMGAPLGLGVGVGLGLSTRSWMGPVKTALAGLSAGILAAATYPIVLSMLLPDVSGDVLIPETLVSRACWLGIHAGVLGLIIPVAGQPRAAKSAARATETTPNEPNPPGPSV